MALDPEYRKRTEKEKNQGGGEGLRKGSNNKVGGRILVIPVM